MSNAIFHVNRAKTEMRHFCLKRYKTRYTLAKRDRIKGSRCGRHPERDQNEIGARYKFASFEAIKGQDEEAVQDTLGFSYLNARRPETPQKRDARLKHAICMNFQGESRTRSLKAPL